MKKHTTRSLRKAKNQNSEIQMLTCYDFQSAKMLSETSVDMLLVGDSLGNVILGYDHTVQVSLQEMITFCAAVKRGAPEKFIVGDLPFGTYATLEKGIESAIELFQKTGVESVKLEGASEMTCKIIKRLTETGIPVMGHIGLTPQSVHEMGGYYTHGKNSESENRLKLEAQKLEEAGVFSLVLECVQQDVAADISASLSIPTIGIGSGRKTDGQVLVLNDLLKMGPDMPPSFCQPVADLYSLKKELVEKYLIGNRPGTEANVSLH